MSEYEKANSLSTESLEEDFSNYAAPVRKRPSVTFADVVTVEEIHHSNQRRNSKTRFYSLSDEGFMGENDGLIADVTKKYKGDATNDKSDTTNFRTTPSNPDSEIKLISKKKSLKKKKRNDVAKNYGSTKKKDNCASNNDSFSSLFESIIIENFHQENGTKQEPSKKTMHRKQSRSNKNAAQAARHEEQPCFSVRTGQEKPRKKKGSFKNRFNNVLSRLKDELQIEDYSSTLSASFKRTNKDDDENSVKSLPCKRKVKIYNSANRKVMNNFSLYARKK